MMPKEEKYFNRKSELIAQITGLLGGRTAEELVFGEISAGAVNDIEKLTSIAKNMVRVYGMSSLGPIQYADPQGMYSLAGITPREATTLQVSLQKLIVKFAQSLMIVIPWPARS